MNVSDQVLPRDLLAQAATTSPSRSPCAASAPARRQRMATPPARGAPRPPVRRRPHRNRDPHPPRDRVRRLIKAARVSGPGHGRKASSSVIRPGVGVSFCLVQIPALEGIGLMFKYDFLSVGNWLHRVGVVCQPGLLGAAGQARVFEVCGRRIRGYREFTAPSSASVTDRRGARR